MNEIHWKWYTFPKITAARAWVRARASKPMLIEMNRTCSLNPLIKFRFALYDITSMFMYIRCRQVTRTQHFSLRFFFFLFKFLSNIDWSFRKKTSCKRIQIFCQIDHHCRRVLKMIEKVENIVRFVSWQKIWFWPSSCFRAPTLTENDDDDQQKKKRREKHS